MLGEYTLFLDESTDKNKLLIAGAIIKNTEISRLSEEIHEVKKIIWDESFLQSNCPILHCTELNYVYNNRKNPNFKTAKGHYNTLVGKGKEEIKEIYDKVYIKLATILKNFNITTLCCCIDIEKYNDLYSISKQKSLLNDFYDICLQSLLESYTHFLHCNSAGGSIVYESRNGSGSISPKDPDHQMMNTFYRIKVNNQGIQNINTKDVCFRIRNISIEGKPDNNAGLQLADFIAFNYMKLIKTTDTSQQTDFMKRIYLETYNGNFDLKSRDVRSYWGLKLLPIDFEKMDSLLAEKRRLSRSNDHLKNERNSLKKKNELIIKEKRAIQNELAELQQKILQGSTN